MPFIAISYPIMPGHDDEIADIFSERNFTRADTPVLRDESGAVVGRNLGTALFIQHDRMARLVHFEGDVRYIGRHMSGQQGVKEAERRLARYLAVPRETQTREGFLTYFRNARMECVFQRETEVRPGRFAALRYTIDPQGIDGIRGAFAELHPGDALGYGPTSGGRPCPIVAEAAFVSGAALVRMLQVDADADDAVGYLAESGHGARTEQLLAPYVAESPALSAPPRDASGVASRLRTRRMRVLQELSIDRPPVRA